MICIKEDKARRRKITKTKMENEIIKIWNDNFNRGVSIFQIFLMVCMIIGVILDNNPVIMVSMVSCLLGYFEPAEDRFSFIITTKEVNEK